MVVVADPLTRVVGDPEPVPTYGLGGRGLANGDRLTGALATTAGADGAPGLYRITQGSLAAPADYVLDFVGADLAVLARPSRPEPVAVAIDATGLASTAERAARLEARPVEPALPLLLGAGPDGGCCGSPTRASTPRWSAPAGRAAASWRRSPRPSAPGPDCPPPPPDPQTGSPDPMSLLPLFYRAAVPLDRDAHRALRLARPQRFGFARTSHLVPAVLDEFGPACRHLPILFVPESQGPTPVFLTGLVPGRCALVDEAGAWTGRYLPAYLRRYPFILGESEEAPPLVCLDDSSEVLHREADAADPSGYVPLFQGDGGDTPLLQERVRLVVEYAEAARRTAAFGRTLQDLGLLRALTVQGRDPAPGRATPCMAGSGSTRPASPRCPRRACCACTGKAGSRRSTPIWSASRRSPTSLSPSPRRNRPGRAGLAAGRRLNGNWLYLAVFTSDCLGEARAGQQEGVQLPVRPPLSPPAGRGEGPRSS